MRDAGSAGQREGRRAGWTGVFWVGVFEVCIFPLAACNYSAPGCRMQQLQTALIRFGHRSGFPDRDVRPIPDQSRIRQKFPFQARKATLVNYGVAQYTELGKGTCHLRHGVQSDPPYVSSPLLPCSHPVLPHRFSAAQMRHLLQLDYDATQRALDSDDTRPPVPAQDVLADSFILIPNTSNPPQPLLSSPCTPRLMHFTPLVVTISSSMQLTHHQGRLRAPVQLRSYPPSIIRNVCKRQLFSDSGFFPSHMTMNSFHPLLAPGT